MKTQRRTIKSEKRPKHKRKQVDCQRERDNTQKQKTKKHGFQNKTQRIQQIIEQPVFTTSKPQQQL